MSNINEIGGIQDKRSSEIAGAQYASSQGAVQGAAQGAAPSATKEVSDQIEVSKPDKTDEVSGANNLDAIKGSFQNREGFNNPGMHPAFVQNSIQGITDMDKGMVAGGVELTG